VPRILLGLVVVAAGVLGMIAFREPVVSYTVEIAGSGDDAGGRVEVSCVDGRATGRHRGEERADRKCLLEEDAARTIQLTKFAVSAVVTIVGLAMVWTGYRVWWRDLRSGMAYSRMMKDHDLAPSGRRFRRKERSSRGSDG